MRTKTSVELSERFSTQRDSEELRLRIERARRAEHLRRTWHAPTLNRKRAA